MSTLETQYKNFVSENPNSNITFDEWLNGVWTSVVSDNFQIGPDGAFEYDDSDGDIKDWDVTLMDGLDLDDDFDY